MTNTDHIDRTNHDDSDAWAQLDNERRRQAEQAALTADPAWLKWLIELDRLFTNEDDGHEVPR